MIFRAMCYPLIYALSYTCRIPGWVWYYSKPVPRYRGHSANKTHHWRMSGLQCEYLILLRFSQNSSYHWGLKLVQWRAMEFRKKGKENKACAHRTCLGLFESSFVFNIKARKAAKIRNRHNQAPHLTQNTPWEK